MIATLAQVKAILGITDTASDAQLSALIPLVADDLITECNNNFLDDSITFSGDCTFSATGGVYKIECADGSMDDSGIVANDIVYVSGSHRADGYYTVSGIADGYIQIVEPVTVDSTAKAVTVTRVNFPYGVQLVFARMVGYQLKHSLDAGIASESIKSYSYSRNIGAGDAGYPAEIIRGLAKWKNIKTGRSRQVEHYPSDKRGSFIASEININDIAE